MAGVASGGQKLTPNRNVTAPAGSGGDLWGANGGGITPIGGGSSDPSLGWKAPIAQTLSDGETATNYQASPPGFFADQSVLTREVTGIPAEIGNPQYGTGPHGQMPGSQPDSSIAAGRSNWG